MQPSQQDIISRLAAANNILVTVKASPTVDELSAALGLTIALNNSGKHATAVFSGQIPNAMSFLKPDKIFENNVHSLRDFIISLNKEKADKLRFAKDGEIVKIYITPYKSTITSEDLSYDEGDFNVEMVVAIGINSQDELDSVIAAHGRILHEATVATLKTGGTPSSLGSINWSEPTLSSSSAMVLQLLQSFNPPVTISPEIATALLTGIVADTDRFSNQNTSPRLMELSAQLMSAGADHQLVTSSIGNGLTPKASNLNTPALNAAESVAPEEPTAPAELDLHAIDSKPDTDLAPIDTSLDQPTPQESAELSATNTAPMVSSPAFSPEDEPAVALPEEPVALTAPAEPTISSGPAPSTRSEQSSFNSALSSVLPQPVDASQTVLPNNLLPPSNLDSAKDLPSLPPVQEPTTSTPELATEPVAEVATVPLGDQPAQPSLPSNQSIPGNSSPEASEILSEIDQIYSAQPFDPANQPRQDMGTQFANPETNTALEEDDPLPPSLLAVDSGVQSNQADQSSLNNPSDGSTLGAIEATKDEAVSSDDILGTSTPLPSLTMPEITPPPPPPPPAGEIPSFTPTVDFNQVKS
jgi:hypothetical protein